MSGTLQIERDVMHVHKTGKRSTQSPGGYKAARTMSSVVGNRVAMRLWMLDVLIQ